MCSLQASRHEFLHKALNVGTGLLSKVFDNGYWIFLRYVNLSKLRNQGNLA